MLADVWCMLRTDTYVKHKSAFGHSQTHNNERLLGIINVHYMGSSLILLIYGVIGTLYPNIPSFSANYV